METIPIEPILCWMTTSGYVAYAGVWFIHKPPLCWRNMFLLHLIPNKYHQLLNRKGHLWSPPLLCAEILDGLSLCKSGAHCHNHCEFICATALKPITEAIHHLLALTFSLASLPQNISTSMTHSSVNWRLGCFHSLAVTRRATADMEGQVTIGLRVIPSFHCFQ